MSGGVHHDGLIWSRALWDIRTALGHTKADTIIVDAVRHPGQLDGPTSRSGTVATAQRLYGKREAAVVTKAFTDRGIL